MRAGWPNVLVLALIAALVYGAVQYGEGRRSAEVSAARRAEQLATDSLSKISQRLEQSEARADSIQVAYETQREPAVQYVTRWRERRDSAANLTNDTAQVRDIVALADSTIEACFLALRSCDSLVAEQDSLAVLLGERNRLLEAQYRAAVAQRPTAWDRLRRDLTIALPVAALAYLVGSLTN